MSRPYIDANGVRHLVLDYTPRPQFKAFHARTQRFACLVCHRRAGKTVACVRDMERAALRNERASPPGRYAFIAPLLRQVKELAWTYLKQGARKIPGSTVNEAELYIEYPNSARLRLYGGDNPESLRGMYLDGVVLDEYADIKPDLYPEIIRPQLIDYNGFAVFIGTPKGRDAFYETWIKAVGDPEWYSLMLRASETGLIPEAEAASARETLSQSQYAREFECSFDEPDVQQFISGIEVAAAVARKSIRCGPRLMGVDVARSAAGDRTVLLYRDGDVLDEISTFRGIDLMQTVGEIASGVSLYKPDMLFIDGVGMGAGVCDRLKQLGFQHIEVNSGMSATESRFKNLRAEMWSKMRDWLRDRAQIPDRHDLANDLCSVLYKYDHRNALQLEGKDEIKKRNMPSPDIADALALTFSQPIAVREVVDFRRQQVQTHAAPYDPLASWRASEYEGHDIPGTGYDPFEAWRSRR